MKKEIILLKLSILMIWILFLSILLFGFISVTGESIINSEKMTKVLYIIIFLFSLSFVPFSVIVYQINKLFNNNTINNIFSISSINSLIMIIKQSILMVIIHLVAIPFFFVVGEVDDAPGVILVGIILFVFPIFIFSMSSILKNVLLTEKK